MIMLMVIMMERGKKAEEKYKETLEIRKIEKFRTLGKEIRCENIKEKIKGRAKIHG